MALPAEGTGGEGVRRGRGGGETEAGTEATASLSNGGAGVRGGRDGGYRGGRSVEDRSVRRGPL